MSKVTVSLEAGQVLEIVAPQVSYNFYRVRSIVKDEVSYVTSAEACTCPDFIYRNRECKHMRGVQMATWYPEATFGEFLTAYREALRCHSCERLQTMIRLAE